MDIVELNKSNEQAVTKVAALYTLVFREPPWCETWSMEKAKNTVLSQELRWWLALEDGNVAGFAAGIVAHASVIETSFKIPSEILTGKRIGYKAEVGVDPIYRRRGVARFLTNALLDHFRSQHVDQFVVRTRPGTGNYPWYCRTLTPLYSYPDGRVIFGHPGVPTL